MHSTLNSVLIRSSFPIIDSRNVNSPTKHKECQSLQLQCRLKSQGIAFDRDKNAMFVVKNYGTLKWPVKGFKENELLIPPVAFELQLKNIPDFLENFAYLHSIVMNTTYHQIPKLSLVHL